MVGRVPLIPLFLAGSTTPTIPHKYSKHWNSCLPMVCADSNREMESATATPMQSTLGCDLCEYVTVFYRYIYVIMYLYFLDTYWYVLLCIKITQNLV
jgi:hypothetical protein